MAFSMVLILSQRLASLKAGRELKGHETSLLSLDGEKAIAAADAHFPFGYERPPKGDCEPGTRRSHRATTSGLRSLNLPARRLVARVLPPVIIWFQRGRPTGLSSFFSSCFNWLCVRITCDDGPTRLTSLEMSRRVEGHSPCRRRRRRHRPVGAEPSERRRRSLPRRMRTSANSTASAPTFLSLSISF